MTRADTIAAAAANGEMGLFGRLLSKYDFCPTPVERCKFRQKIRAIGDGCCGCVCCNPEEYEAILGRKLYRCFSCVCCLGVDGADDPFYDHPQLVREVDVYGTVHLYLNTKKGAVVQRYRHHEWPVELEESTRQEGERPGAITHFEACVDVFEEDSLVDSDLERVMQSESKASSVRSTDSAEDDMEWGIEEFFEEVKSPSSSTSSGETPTAPRPSLDTEEEQEDGGYPWLTPSVEVSSFDELAALTGKEKTEQPEEGSKRELCIRILAYTASAYWCHRQQRFVGRLDRRHEKLASWCEVHRFLVKFNMQPVHYAAAVHAMAQFMSLLG